MLFGKDTSNVIESELLVDSWKVEYEDEDIIETYGVGFDL
jgi:hypothetical protein